METIVDDTTALCYMKVDHEGWFVSSVYSAEIKNDKEILIPIFPTVFKPPIETKQYYDAVLNSDIKVGDKVLVLGCGSGSDVWVSWLKSKSLVYAIDINPQAILNTYATAKLGGFKVRPLQGDIRDMELPEDFKDFDYVLFNIPYLRDGNLEQNDYHDFDDGSVAKAFMKMLPSLLKKGGKAIFRNTNKIEDFINLPMITNGDADLAVYTLTNK